MSDAATPDTGAQLLRALTSLQEMRRRLEVAEGARTEPIAIIGMGCRLPGAANPDELWRLLRDGRDAITETPTDRWDVGSLYDPAPDAAGKVATRWGGFLDGLDRFDAAFFGISPREAAQMDPQQRLLLEVAWEALEDGGQSVDDLAGTDTGVFVGMHSHSEDYYLLQADDPSTIDLYSGTGTSHSVASGRLSYLFDFRGPSLAVDTACSSSLVAVHLAVQSLRNRECSLAIAGGVNAILDPTFTMVASRMRMMSPTGRCRPFAAGGDGFVRAEGCAAVVLKRLSDAQADGDRVLAVVQGTAMNQDGRSNGLTAPNSLSQQAVITAALANAGLRSTAIDLVETHGTGTPLGDPIEIEALSAVFAGHGDGSPRTAPTALGSLKANIGHAEGAAGVAALVKTVLSLRAGEVVPMLHFDELNPHITLDGTPFVIPTAVMPWPAGGERRCAGVSSFGWSGTNAHVVIAEAPAVRDDGVFAADPPFVLPVSARSPGALLALAGRYRDLLVARHDDDVAGVCSTAATRRSHHDHRLAVSGRTRDDLIEALDAWLGGFEHRRLSAGVARPGSDLVVFVFPGQGGQWSGMAADLMSGEPVFRDAVDRCAAALAPHVGWSLLDVLSDPTGARLGEIDVVQPALFAVQVALAALWASRGVVPDAVVGHSMGEVAAAHVAGILTLDDAARVIGVRSRLLRSISGRGAMAVVELDVGTAADRIAGFEDRLSIAVSNSRSSTVLSGDPTALDEVMARLEAEGTFCRKVNVDVASHSPQVEPLMEPLVAELAPITVQAGRVAFMSTVTGRFEDGDALGAHYWSRNLRERVRLVDAVEALIDSGHTRFVELGPHPLLAGAIEESLRDADTDGIAICCLRRESDGPTDMLHALGALYAHGQPIDWKRVYAAAPPADLPAYPWERERHWLERSGRRTRAAVADRVNELIHGFAWRPAAPASADRDGIVTHWLVVTCGTANGDALAARLRASGTPCAVVALDAARPAALDAPHGEHLGAVGGHLGVVGGHLGVVILADSATAGATVSEIANHQVEQTTAVLELVTALDRLAHRVTLWIATAGTQVAVAGDDARGFADATLWGLGRAIGEELPLLWGGNIDLDPSATPDAAADALARELTRLGSDDAVDSEVALRGDRRFVQRMVRTAIDSSAPVRLEGSVLVTGGFGAVGRHVARWAVDQGARSVVLLSRTTLPPPSEWADHEPGSAVGRRIAGVQELEAMGVAVHVAAVDVGDEAALTTFLDTFASSGWPPIRSVFHAAAEFGGDLVAEVDHEAVARQLRAKIVGSLMFHRLRDLDHLVLFSSVAAVLPVAGQSAYAGANAFMDALADHRATTGRRALSVNWGFWEGSDDADVGEGRSIKATADALATSRGMTGFGTVEGLEAMRRLLASPIAHAAVLPIDWSVLAASGVGTVAGLASERIAEAPTATAPVIVEGADAEPGLRQQIEAAGDERVEVAEHLVRRIVGRVLRMPADRIDPTAPFGSLGFDSLMSIELRNELERELGMKLSATLAWNHPSVRELSQYVLGLLAPRSGSAATPDATIVSAAGVADLTSGVDGLSDDEALAALMGGDVS